MSKVNYHTHTARCMHADGADRDYLESALKSGFETIGFSDHSPWPYASGYVSTVRMLPAQLPEYLASVRGLRDEYADRIRVLVGLECEYFPRYLDWLRDTARREQLDYLIFGNHFYGSDEDGPYFGSATKDLTMLRRYTESAIAGMECGLFSYFAHPDLFMRCYPGFDENAKAASREICRAAKRLGMPLEYNLMGSLYCEKYHINGYPYPGFWRIAAEEGCTAIIGVDAHSPAHLENPRFWNEGLQLLRGLGIQRTRTIRLRAWEKDPAGETVSR